jgi:hypothetical protein
LTPITPEVATELLWSVTSLSLGRTRIGARLDGISV